MAHPFSGRRGKRCNGSQGGTLHSSPARAFCFLGSGGGFRWSICLFGLSQSIYRVLIRLLIALARDFLLQNNGCFMVSKIMSIGAKWMDALSDDEKIMGFLRWFQDSQGKDTFLSMAKHPAWVMNYPFKTCRDANSPLSARSCSDSKAHMKFTGKEHFLRMW